MTKECRALRRALHRHQFLRRNRCRVPPHATTGTRQLHQTSPAFLKAQERLRRGQSLEEFGELIEDKYAALRDKYQCPKHPIILAHGLLGFDELRLAGQTLPGIQYWRGIKEALSSHGIEAITAPVSASGSIEARAATLAKNIAVRAQGKSVNIVAHSMGGLDARYMISQLKPEGVDVKSLTTIATPHRGSAVADYMLESIGAANLPRLYDALEWVGLETGAFSQLTRRYMQRQFNPKTPDREGVRYFSFGASLEPTFWSVFWPSNKIILEMEGGAPNDGLVSVASSVWGDYRGTLVGVSHLDLINWTNRIKLVWGNITGTGSKFNGAAFYLDIADMLANEGL